MTIFIVPFASPGAPFGHLDYWAAIAAFTAKVYFDFTGYSDIAIGVSGLLGFSILENFDMPYRTANIGEFWRRWHISLSSWIRDYVFIPLGGSRRPAPIVALNLIFAMGLCGLWHGANWTFVVWGLYNGALLAVHRLWAQHVVPNVRFLARPSRLVYFGSVALNLAFIFAGWYLFNAKSLSGAFAAFQATFF